MVAIRKLIVVALFSIGALAACRWIYALDSWAAAMPAHPQPATGHVYRQNLHGSVFYLTKSEDRLLLLLQVLALGASIAGGALSLRFGVYSYPLRGLSADQQYKVLHGPRSDYEKARESQKERGS
jgi:hypothetical protein